MNRKHLLSVPLGAAMAFALSVGAVGCLISGFDLPLEDGNKLTFLCAAASVTGALLFSWSWGGYAAAGLLALLGGYLWHQGTAGAHIFALINRVSHFYDSAYGWGVLDRAVSDVPVDLPMGLLALLIALAAARAVCRGKGTWLALLLSAAPLAACLVVTDTVPEVPYLLALLAGLLLLIFRAGVRQEDANRLVLLLTLPVLAGLGLLFQLSPQEDYVNQSKEIQEAILSRMEQLPQKLESAMEEISTSLPGDGQKNLDLKQLGKRNQYTYPVMDITADRGGILYLRGQDYDSYTGTGWTASSFRSEDFGFAGEAAGTLTIRTRSLKDLLYLPYYPGESQTLTGGVLANPEGRREYTWNCAVIPENWEESMTPDDGQIHLTQLEVQAFGSTAERLRYVTLPGETDVRATAILKTLLPENASRREVADAIAEYVKNSAEYDLDTGRMPGEEEDFALWFLEDSETGYCVHFATAAVVLLRAADIPARYVTGYMVQTRPGETVTVTAASAHAWAEYYVPGLNAWVVLEATPGEALYIPQEDATVQTDAPTPVPEASGEAVVPVPTETPETTGSTVPTEQTDPPQEHPEERHNGGWLLWLLLPLVLQYPLRLRLWEKLRYDGSPNRQALRRWQEAEILARLRRETPPKSLFDLAQKAKFSQHTITAEELSSFDAYRADCIGWMRQQSWYRQLVYRFIWAVY